MTNPIEEAITLLPELEKYPASNNAPNAVYSIPAMFLLPIIAALEAMRDQKARDDAMFNAVVKAALENCKKIADEESVNATLFQKGSVSQECFLHGELTAKRILDMLFALTKPSEFVVVPLKPDRKMLDAGETALENAQDTSYDSDYEGNRHEYTYFVGGLTGAALSIYSAMLKAME